MNGGGANVVPAVMGKSPQPVALRFAAPRCDGATRGHQFLCAHSIRKGILALSCGPAAYRTPIQVEN